MPNVDPEAVHATGQAIEDNVVPILQSANEYLPVMEELDLALYTIVLWPLAISYTVATSFTREAIAGASENFRDMHAKLDACAADWADADDAVACQFTMEEG